MHIRTIPVGRLQTNCYVVTDPETKYAAVIDPGDEGHLIQQYLEDEGITPKAVFLTHGHYDHTTAADDLSLEWDIPVYISLGDVSNDSRPNPHLYKPAGDTRFWKEGDEIGIGNLRFQVLATPGHSHGSVCLLVEDCLFTGDTLFRDDCGRTDLTNGNSDLMAKSLARIDKLSPTGNLEIYPGHAEATTLERERRFNYYLRQASTGSR